MKPGKRGRRTVAEELGTIERLQARPLPDLGRDPVSILDAVAELWRRVGAGEVDRPTAEVLAKLARTALSAEKQHHERTEIIELRELLALAERQRAEADERECAIQQGRTPGPATHRNGGA